MGAFHQHRRIMQAAGGLTYYTGQGGSFTARQVTPVEHDEEPGWLVDVYVPVFSLARLSGKRGGNGDVAGAGGLFAEFDAKDFVSEAESAAFYAAPDTPTDRAISDAWATARKRALLSSTQLFGAVLERVDAHIASLATPPSTIVSSGGGRHCYWYLDEPVRFTTEDARRRFAALLAAWIDYVGGDHGARDLARVLRVPGSVNGKQGYTDLFGAPPPVEFLAFDPTRRYALAELEGLLPVGWDAPTHARATRKLRQFTGGRGAPAPQHAGDLPDSGEVRRYNAQHRIEDELRRAGCTHLHRNRWTTPQSTSGQSSVTVNAAGNHAWAFSGKNPTGREGMIRPADLALQTDYGGDVESFLAELRRGSVDLDHLYQVAAYGDIEPPLRLRLGIIAEAARKAAAAAAATFAENPTDKNEAHALRMAQRAEQAEARISAHSGSDANRRRLMVALLDKLSTTGGAPVRCSNLELAASANMSRHTVITLMNELEDWFVVSEKNGTRAALIQLSPVAQQIPFFAQDLTGDVQTCAKNGNSPLRTHYAHDAMCAAMTPRPDTPEERRRVAQTAQAIRSGLNVKPRAGDCVAPEIPVFAQDLTSPVQTCAKNGSSPLVRDPLPESDAHRHQLAAGYLYTQRSRFAASLPSLGGRVLLLLSHVQAMGGVASLADLGRRMGAKANRISEMVRRLLAVGLAEKPDRYTVRLVDDWEAVLDEKVRLMPTFGSAAVRRADWINGAIAYQEHRMRQTIDQGNAYPEQAEELHNLVNVIQRRLDRLEAQRAELEDWAKAHLPPHRAARLQRRAGTPQEHAQAEHRRRLLRAGQLAARDEALAAARHAEACLAQGMDGKQAERALALAGFTPTAAAYGLSAAHRYAEALGDAPRTTIWRDGAWVEVGA